MTTTFIPGTEAPAPSECDLIALVDQIAAIDGVDIPESLGTLDAYPDAFVISAIRDGRAVGLASASGARPPEIGIAIHPDCRRQGIARQLISELQCELVRRGHTEALLISERASASGIAFLESIAAPYQFSEFRLERSGDVSPDLQLPVGFDVRRADHADRGLMIELLARAFDDREATAAETIDDGLRETDRHFAIAAFDGVPMGVVRVGEWAGLGDITALGVIPEYRGRGLGRSLLMWAVAYLADQGHQRIALEVATDNANALGLYQSCGFVVTNEFAYHSFPFA